MGMKLAVNNTTFYNVKPGTYFGRVLNVAFVGTQTTTFNKVDSLVPQLMFRVELYQEDEADKQVKVIKNPETGDNFTTVQYVTVSFADRAKLPGIVGVLRGKPLTKDDIKKYTSEGFDPEVLVGRWALVSMNPSPTDKSENPKTFIGGWMPLMGGSKPVADPNSKTEYWDTEMTVMKQKPIPAWCARKMKKSQEYQTMDVIKKAVDEAMAKLKAEGEGEDAKEDDVPF